MQCGSAGQPAAAACLVGLCRPHQLAAGWLSGWLQVSGSKFYYLRNAAALLELALVNFAMTFVTARGFTPIMTPGRWRRSSSPP
jgi:seryl-tRNA synthetase